MPLPFSNVCDLLEQSYRLCQARKSNTPAVHDWFRRHRTRIDAHDTGLAALLSTLLPEKRTDRVYCIQASTLEKIIGRALMLGASRMIELAAYKRPGTGLDLADCVERILSITPNPAQSEQFQVTVEEIDQLLHGLASRIRWSSPSIRQTNNNGNGNGNSTSMSHHSRGDLEDIYRRLPARDAKWFTRLVLKDYQPLIFDAHMIYRACDPILPCILKIRDDFTEALDAIAVARGSLLPTTTSMGGGGGGGAAQNARRVLAAVKPKLGVKVGRQQWHKGRSIKHCIDMGARAGGSRRMSVETKMDGEYCQIHVDMSKSKGRRVQIFSKSGKDSTEDRQGVIAAIERALRLDKNDCAFQTACVLEGELVVYNDLENVIMPFHKIRGHVARRGRFMNTEQDSQPKPYEHLMMIYYDVFLMDGQSLLDVRHSERIKLLEKVVHCERGIAALVQRETIDFGHVLAASALRKAFAKVVIERGEGLVLKPDEPYIVIGENGQTTTCRCIKLKKEYIGSFGDVGDFALVGAGFHAAKARTYRIPNLRWTHFYIGCLNNKEEVKRWSHEKPSFTVVCAVELPEPLLQSFIALGELTAVPRAENQSTKLIVAPGIQCPVGLTVAFTNPPVVDLRCFSFDKPGNTGFWTPRFPSITKIHTDRDYADVLTFGELQTMARDAVDKPEFEDSQENLHWIAKLEGADPRGIAVDAVSQATATTIPTPSPAKTTQSGTTDSQSQHSKVDVGTGRCIPPAVSQAAVERGARARQDVSISIISISTSSAVDESPPQPTVPETCKRAYETSSGEQSFKRRRTHSFQGSRPALPPPEQMNASTRTPLGNIDVNVSYGDAQSSVDSQDSQATVKLKPVPEADANRGCCSVAASQQVVIEILSSDDEDENDDDGDDEPTQRIQSQHLMKPQSIPALEPRETALDSLCRHVGAECGLVGKTILLSSAALLRSPEVTSIFADHGIVQKSIIPCVEKWWEIELHKMANGDDTAEKKKQSRMLLVDSVQQSAETKALIARLNGARNDFRREERDWITVYDWRVLKHISIAEDASVTKKYYDGFQDPWRRWYCGLV